MSKYSRENMKILNKMLRNIYLIIIYTNLKEKKVEQTLLNNGFVVI